MMTDGLERLRYAWQKADVDNRVAFLREIYQRSSDEAPILEVNSLVGVTRLEPMVELRWRDQLVQWSPEQAMVHAQSLLSAAEAAIHDAWFIGFVESRLGLSREQGMQVLLELRAWRQRRNELPEDPEGVTES